MKVTSGSTATVHVDRKANRDRQGEKNGMPWKVFQNPFQKISVVPVSGNLTHKKIPTGKIRKKVILF